MKVVRIKRGDLSPAEKAAEVRGFVVAMKPGNAGGAKGPREGDA